jgi:hypothetical protein
MAIPPLVHCLTNTSRNEPTLSAKLPASQPQYHSLSFPSLSVSMTCKTLGDFISGGFVSAHVRPEKESKRYGLPWTVVGNGLYE